MLTSLLRLSAHCVWWTEQWPCLMPLLEWRSGTLPPPLPFPPSPSLHFPLLHSPFFFSSFLLTAGTEHHCVETSQQIQHPTHRLCQQAGQTCSKVADRLLHVTRTLPSFYLPLPSLSHTVQSMEARLRATPLVTQLPLGEGREFCGVIDLITMEALTWERGTDGATFSRVPLQKGAVSEVTLKEAMQARYHLAEQVHTFVTGWSCPRSKQSSSPPPL